MADGLGQAFTDAVMGSLAEAVYAIDTDGRLTFMNRAAERLLGWRQGELLGRSVHEMVHAHGSGAACPMLTVLASGEADHNDDDRFVARGGRPVTVAWTSSPMRDDRGAVVGAVVALHDVASVRLARDVLRREAQRNETLLHVARTLTGELDLESLLQSVTDAGVLLTRAAVGAFFYDVVDEHGETCTLATVAGVPRDAFDRPPVSWPAFDGDRVVRFDDITTQPGNDTSGSRFGIPVGRIPVRSYLAVPVLSRRGEPIGGLFFGHPEPGVFGEDDERLVAGIAAHAAVAADNAQLFDREQRVAEFLQRSLLPRSLPTLAGIRAVARYLPSSSDAEVGGDWYDLFPLRGSTVGAVIGDVAGHNIAAATVMGQIRNALRGYAIEGHPPAVVMERANQFLCLLEPDEMATCCYVELDQRGGIATAVSAGHPPPVLLTAGGRPVYVEVVPGPPLGCDPRARFAESTVLLHGAVRLILYTDGLIERRGASLTDGMDALLAAVEPVAGERPDAIADRILAVGRPATLADDTALLVLAINATESDQRRVARRLPCDPASVAVARRFVADVLAQWGVGGPVDTVQLLVSELVTNAVLHTAGSLDVRLAISDGRLRVEVADDSAERPVRLHGAGAEDASGRGLHLVETIAHSWGVEDAADGGKIVYFELAVHDVDVTSTSA